MRVELLKTVKYLKASLRVFEEHINRNILDLSSADKIDDQLILLLGFRFKRKSLPSLLCSLVTSAFVKSKDFSLVVLLNLVYDEFVGTWDMVLII